MPDANLFFCTESSIFYYPELGQEWMYTKNCCASRHFQIFYVLIIWFWKDTNAFHLGCNGIDVTKMIC